MKLVTVRQTFSPAEAQVVRSRLEAADFQPSLAHELSSLSLDGFPLVLVQVPEDEAVAARELLDADEPPAAV
jgi:hypothetical protein